MLGRMLFPRHLFHQAPETAIGHSRPPTIPPGMGKGGPFQRRSTVRLRRWFPFSLHTALRRLLVVLGWTAAAATITNLVDVQTRIAVAVPGGTKTRKHFVFETGPFTVRMVLLVWVMMLVTTANTAPRMVRTIFNIRDFRGVRGIDNKGLGGFGE